MFIEKNISILDEVFLVPLPKNAIQTIVNSSNFEHFEEFYNENVNIFD